MIAWHCTDCIKQDFKKYYSVQPFPNCSTPWTQSTLGNIDYIDTNPCTNEEAIKELALGTQYFYDTINQKNLNCPSTNKIQCLTKLDYLCFIVSCAELTYTTTTHKLALTNGIVNHLPLEKVQDSILLYIFYQSTDVKNSQQIPIMTFWGFISAAGGSMGLFLGFSCLSSVWSLFDLMEKRIQCWSQNPVQDPDVEQNKKYSVASLSSLPFSYELRGSTANISMTPSPSPPCNSPPKIHVDPPYEIRENECDIKSINSQVSHRKLFI